MTNHPLAVGHWAIHLTHPSFRVLICKIVLAQVLEGYWQPSLLGLMWVLTNIMSIEHLARCVALVNVS